MSQANANFAKNTAQTESKSDSGQLKEFRTPPHNLSIEQAVLAEATYGKISKDSSPITAGWTEIRKMCFLDIIYKNLKEKNEENK